MSPELEALELAMLAARAAEGRKARDVMVMEMRDLTTLTDYFVLASGRTPIQVRAMSDQVEDEAARRGVRLLHREGYDRGRWVLLDYGDVVVHLFCEEERKFYALERLWGDAPVVYAAGSPVLAVESGE
ncbi:MAG: ribosome silencing factor [Bacillota bacterium]|nr:ribosome silencing factor [Bacillota bacterium]